MFCTSCENPSKLHWRKDLSCDNARCKRNKLKYQCIACDKLYGSYQGAYCHIKSRVCNDFEGFPQTPVPEPKKIPEIKKLPEITKKFNPYNKKFKKAKIRVHNKSKIEKCFKCEKTFKNRSGLNTHKLYCGVQKAIKCEFCNFSSYSKEVILKHVKYQHIKTELCQTLNVKVPQKLKCSNESNIRRNNTYSHSVKFNNPKPDNTKSNNINSNCNIKKRKKRKNLGWSRGRIMKHKPKPQPGPAEDQFYCAHCQFKSRRKDNLLSHIQCVHKNIYPKNYFRCKLCNENCHNQYRLQSHYNLKKCFRSQDLKVIMINDVKSIR